MKHVWTISVASLAIGMLFVFQNCGAAGRSVAGSMSSGSLHAGLSSTGGDDSSMGGGVGSDETVSGNTVTIADGQSLTFTNNLGVPFNKIIFKGSQPGTSGLVYVFSYQIVSDAGRTASFNIVTNLDKTEIIEVEQTDLVPYMCHNPIADPCASYPNLGSGAMESNCNSAINFTGVITGSIGNVNDTAYTAYNCASHVNPAPSTGSTGSGVGSAATSTTGVCHLAYASGASATTGNQSLAACQSECRINANQNKGEKIVCTLDGQTISY